jgi:hypothetical protein
MSMDVLAQANADPADRRALNLNTKICRRMSVHRLLQKFLRVVVRVRMRKSIAQGGPHFAIISPLRERLRVVKSPRANGASVQDELHRLL